MQIISPFCAAAREADGQAFAAVMRHIKSVDATERTVIMMQVENETGLLGTDRDYSPLATKQYNSQVPAELMTYLGTFSGTKCKFEQRLNGDEQHINLLRKPGILRVKLYSVKRVSRGGMFSGSAASISSYPTTREAFGHN